MTKLLKKHMDKVSQDGTNNNIAIAKVWQTVIAKGEKRTLEE